MICNEPDLYLSCFNTLTVYLYHPVLTVNIEYTSVRKKSAHITCMIEHTVFIIRERILFKYLCRLFGKIHIALCKMSANAYLALFAGRHLFAVIVKQYDTAIMICFAYRRIVIGFIKMKCQCAIGL